jgi:pyruvate formate lyase activating enzyme
MLIGGLLKFSSIDFPSKMAAVVFTQGCPFLCQYCHNPSLVLQKLFSKPISEEEIFSFLKKRKDKLDGVVISGGEPTIQEGLIDFIKKIKALNFLIKLDTNGINPKIIKYLIDNKLIDYIAMDIKGPLEKYALFIQKDIDTSLILESIKLILNSSIDYEFRSTLVKNLHEIQDIEKMAKLILNAKLFILQKYISKTSLNQNLTKSSFSDEEFEMMKKTSEKYVKKCLVR